MVASVRIEASTVADARRGADGERSAEQQARPSSTRARDQAGREDPLRPRQQADEGEPEDDEHEAGELGLPIEGQHAADRSRARSEDDEDDREPGDERQAPERNAPRGPRLAEPVGLDR